MFFCLKVVLECIEIGQRSSRCRHHCTGTTLFGLQGRLPISLAVRAPASGTGPAAPPPYLRLPRPLGPVNLPVRYTLSFSTFFFLSLCSGFSLSITQLLRVRDHMCIGNPQVQCLVMLLEKGLFLYLSIAFTLCKSFSLSFLLFISSISRFVF